MVTDGTFAESGGQSTLHGSIYDKRAGTGLAALRDAAKVEGYMNDSTKQAFDVLEKLLKHNLSQDLDNNRKAIEEILAPEIVSRYYYERTVRQTRRATTDDARGRCSTAWQRH